MTKKGRKHRTYQIDLKLKAIRLSEQGITDAEICEQLGIHDQGRLNIWRKEIPGGEGVWGAGNTWPQA